MPSTNKKVRNVASHTKMAFDRQEFKYLVPLSVVDHIIAQLDQIMVRDKFSKDDYYGVYSIYFDTHDWQAFYSKMDGNLHRKKLRLRSYSKKPEPNEKIFAEIKEKDDREILKRRVAITQSEVKKFINGEPGKDRNNVQDEWRHSLLRNALKPKLLNSYKRLAYHSRSVDGMRITIDKDVSYALTDRIVFDQPTKKVTWANDYCVMEVKFRQYLPVQTANIIEHSKLSRAAVSKYSDSVISNFLLT